MVERMIGTKTGTGGSTGAALPAQPARPALLPAAVGPALGALSAGPAATAATRGPRPCLSRRHNGGVLGSECVDDDAGRQDKADLARARPSTWRSRRQGHRGPAARRRSAALLTALLPPRRARGRRRPQRRRPVRRRCATHYKLAGDRPQGTAKVRVFTPTPRRARLVGRRAHVVEVVTDDMPFLVDSVTMELDAPAARRAHGRSTRSFVVRRDITGALQSVHAGRGRLARARAGDGGPRVVDAHRDRPRVREGDDTDAIERGPASRCCATSARPSRTGRRCTPQVAGDRRATSTSDPPPLPAEEIARGPARC